MPSIALFMLLALQSAGPPPVHDRRIANLEAFARLYGYVRFFHPSDEAAALDWDRFAVYGAGYVKDAPSAAALRERLGALFGPVAPALVLYRDGEALPPHRHVPMDTAGLVAVAWQHHGVRLSPGSNIYQSVRTHRSDTVAAPGAQFAVLTQALPAESYRGLRIRLRAHVRADVRGVGNQAQLWLRVDRPDGASGFFDNMQDRPITSPVWRRYEIVGEVAADAERVVFGGLVQGMGSFAFDGFELAVAARTGDAWTRVELGNPGFEADEPMVTVREARGALGPDTDRQWLAMASGYEHGFTDAAAEGVRAATIRTATTVVEGPLLEQTPAPGESVDRVLGGGVRARIPISLFSNDRGTLPRPAAGALERLHAALDTVDLGRVSGADANTRLAAVIIAWNVFQHFYPYFDVVDVDWDRVLPDVLARALADTDGAAFMRTMRWLVAQIADGHGRVIHPIYTRTGGIPWRVEWVEDRVVVTAAEDSVFRRGDVVLTLDGIPAATRLVEEERLISGSPQWKRYRGLEALGAGERGTTARIRLLRDGVARTVEVERGRRRAIVEFDRPMISRLEPGIWYVDLDRAPWAAIDSVIDSLAAAEGVIFDLRGYPAGNHQVLQHLLTRPDTSGAWMRTPYFLYPDRQRPAGFRLNGWRLPPRAPHIGGRVAFITDGRAISYAESFLGLVEHYRLGDIVGQPTAGTNGNVNRIPLPGGFTVTWTGMRVVKHDGSQHHLVGILPTVPATRTLAGIRAGRDELLDVALDVVRSVP